MDIVAGQAIGAEGDDGVDEPGGSSVAHTVQPGPVKTGAGVPFVGAGHLDRPRFGYRPSLQGIKL